MQSLADAVAEEAERSAFSGVVRVDRAGRTEVFAAYGLAHRALGLPNGVETRLGTASATKGVTALVVMSLVEQGVLTLDTTARSLLGDDLPLIDDAVTIEHLLAHRSGIGDYLDESALESITDHVLSVPVHELDTVEAYLAVLDGHPTVSAPGEVFAYNNGGYVLLSLLAERASSSSYHRLTRDLVTGPAGMRATDFLRSDELPGDAALGYLSAEGPRTNVLHLPVLGAGDGGLYSTASDFANLWEALFDGRIVSAATVAEMVRPRSDWPEESERYGLGFHLHQTGDAVWLEGYDAGVSFSSLHQPSRKVTYTVISNWSDGAWPLVRLLDDRLGI